MNASETRPRAFGVDPTRRERYSLRQARYDALAEYLDSQVDLLNAANPEAKQPLSVLDLGCGWGALLCHLENRKNYRQIALSGADIKDNRAYKPAVYQRYFVSDLLQGCPDIPSEAYDVVICEQVLEHIKDLGTAITALERMAKPGGKIVIGVPIFLPPLPFIRNLFVRNLKDRFWKDNEEWSHVQTFSLYSFRDVLSRFSNLKVEKVRGFRIISGGVLRFLENYRWWWKFNRWLGECFPAACIEIQVITTKPS